MNKYQTKQRQILVSFFEDKGHHAFSALEIYEQLQSQNISKSAIYRNLSEMVADGSLYKVYENHRKEALFQCAAPSGCQKIIHLKCQICQAVIHFDKHISQMMLNMAAKNYSFEVNDNLLLYGKCGKCSNRDET